MGVLRYMRTSFEEKENRISGRRHSFYDEKMNWGPADSMTDEKTAQMWIVYWDESIPMPVIV